MTLLCTGAAILSLLVPGHRRANWPNALLERNAIALDHIRAGRAARPSILYGLRGVGKTVLLTAMRDAAEGEGMTVSPTAATLMPIPPIPPISSSRSERRRRNGRVPSCW